MHIDTVFFCLQPIQPAVNSLDSYLMRSLLFARNGGPLAVSQPFMQEACSINTWYCNFCCLDMLP